MTKIIGIDLGTSNSAAAVLEGGKPKIIPSAEGMQQCMEKHFQVLLHLQKTDNCLVGEPARRQAVSNPEGTIHGCKKKNGNRL